MILKYYCTCGGAIEIEANADDALKAFELFRKPHQRPGHAETTKRKAQAAFEKQNVESAERERSE